MSKMTKHAIAASFMQLLREKPLSKITISDITENCEINRMTFYYHFQDIYDLIEWICMEEGARAIQGHKNYSTWQEGFQALCYKVIENRIFVENVYHSVQREQIENYMYTVMHHLLIGVVEEQSTDLEVSEEDKCFVADFYKYAFVGIALNWVKTGMKESPEELTKQVSTLLKGQLRLALENFDSNHHKEKSRDL